MAVERVEMLEDTPPLITDPVEAAESAGLRYYTDARPGIQRTRVGDQLQYIHANGTPVTEEKTLARIASLGIPPAWTDVWICPSPRGHIQATGRDAKGRKQYRYHPHWREVRDETKYTRMIVFGEVLPVIRERTAADITIRDMTRDKVLAAVVQLLDTTSIRVGNEEYARENQHFGLTTLHHDHVDVEGSTIRFHFLGKSGKQQEVDIRDRRLARVIKRCEEIPGQELFQYYDAQGELQTVDSADVNDYLRQATGDNFTAKDFRTWHGTVTAAATLYKLGHAETQTEAKKNVVEAIKATADHLGNTPAIARKSYVHPAVIEAYLEGTLIPLWKQVVEQGGAGPHPGLHPDEVATLALLESCAEEMKEQQRAS